MDDRIRGYTYFHISKTLEKDDKIVVTVLTSTLCMVSSQTMFVPSTYRPLMS